MGTGMLRRGHYTRAPYQYSYRVLLNTDTITRVVYSYVYSGTRTNLQKINRSNHPMIHSTKQVIWKSSSMPLLRLGLFCFWNPPIHETQHYVLYPITASMVHTCLCLVAFQAYQGLLFCSLRPGVCVLCIAF